MGSCCSKKKVNPDDFDGIYKQLSYNEEIENIRVAVRVRQFMPREIENGSELVIKMEANKTTLLQYGENYDREFEYDYSYWSFDGFEKQSNGYFAPSARSNYIDQNRIYNDIGSHVINNMFRGYHTTLFAYGQTGSGKTYTMFGDSNNKGIIPLLCINICKQSASLEEKNNGKTKLEFSMLEIYNEKLNDLMSERNTQLTIREATSGFFIPGLLEVPMTEQNYKDLLNVGLKKRVTAETKMNDKSSRSHVIITVKLTQNENGVKKISQVNLVDLAGSEWNKKTESIGMRFEEAKAINRSLMQLSLCLYNLSEGIYPIPYRESSLTKLLKNSLQNNGKTFMIATVSPASDNYLETLSTLRYAERTKGIKVKARINYEDPRDVIISELERENKHLKQEIQKFYQSIPRDILQKYVQ